MRWRVNCHKHHQARRGASRLQGFSPLALVALLILLGGCVSVVPKELRPEIDRSISFRELKEDPDAFTGRTALLGGEIIEAKNLQDETELEILQKPLGRGDVPMDTDESEGRFLVHHSGYLDPAIYRSGRHLTVVGEVMGGKSLKIGEAEYRYPVLTSKFLHLWVKARRYYDPYYSPYYYPFSPYGGFYYHWLFYYHYPFWPYWEDGRPYGRHFHKR